MAALSTPMGPSRIATSTLVAARSAATTAAAPRAFRNRTRSMTDMLEPLGIVPAASSGGRSGHADATLGGRPIVLGRPLRHSAYGCNLPVASGAPQTGTSAEHLGRAAPGIARRHALGFVL